MVLLYDNDIILKLTAFGLLKTVTEALDGDPVYVLETAIYRLRKPGRQMRQQHSDQTIALALDWCESVNSLNGAVVDEDADALQNASYINANGQVCQIDEGELILFSQAFCRPHARLLTGDKRALFALGMHRLNSSHARSIHDSLNRRVICLEAAIELCIAVNGFSSVCDQITPNRSCDKVMQVVFGSGSQTIQSNAEAALKSYINHEETTLGQGWLWRP